MSSPNAQNRAGEESSLCAECEGPAATAALRSRSGERLCAACVEAYYVACAACGGLVARDEALARDGGAPRCADCHARPASEENFGEVDETLLGTLVEEYVALHAEEKRIKERMEALKERLKQAATARRGDEGGAVVLRAGDAAVRCSYRKSLKCDGEAVETVARLLDDEEFAALFERKVSYNTNRERLEEFLSATDEAHDAARRAVREAVQETEVVSLTVERPRARA